MGVWLSGPATAVTALPLVAPFSSPVDTGAAQLPSALRCAKLVPLLPDNMICRAPGALADGMIHVCTLLNPVMASVRLIDPCNVLASALGVNVSVSASDTPLLARGNAATTDEPAKASDGESIE